MTKWVVVSGASSGIGKATALRFADHGFSICLIARRHQQLEEVAQQIKSKHAKVNSSVEPMIIVADLSTDEGIDQVIDQLNGQSIHYLIHNAATIEPIIPLREISRAQWRRHFTLNVEAPLFITQALTKELAGGRVIHISSGAAHKSIAGWGAYCASKAALYSIWSTFKEELAALNITLASVRPGVVDTDMQRLIRQADHPIFEKRSYFEELKNNHQLISAEEVAEYLYVLCTQISKHELQAKEWDIRDE